MVSATGKTGPLAERPMVPLQYLVVLLCVVCNIMDGFDTVSMALTAPAIRREWGLTPEMLGVVFSAATFGLVLGALTLPPLADRFGRRTIIIASTAIASISMLAASRSQSLPQLLAARFAVGVAIGALVPSLNVMVAEYSNRKLGSFFLSVLHVGFGLGVFLCSVVAVSLLDLGGWRAVFLVACLAHLALCVLAIVALPESLEFLMSGRRPRSLERTNKLLPRLGMAPIEALPESTTKAVGLEAPGRGLLASAFLAPILLLTVATMAHYFVNYFKSGWTPTILIDLGLKDTVALMTGGVMGLGGASGSLVMGALARRFAPRPLTIGAFVAAAIALMIFAFTGPHATVLFVAAASMSFFISATFTGVIISATDYFPAERRGTSLGLIIGLGRIGGIGGPVIGGFLIGLGWERPAYFPFFAGACLLGALAILVFGRVVTRASAKVRPEPAVA